MQEVQICEKNIEPILKCCKNLITKIIHDFGIKREHYEDCLQIGRIAVWKAIKNFLPEKKVKFTTFAYICIRNDILAFINSERRHRSKQTVVPEIEETIETPEEIWEFLPNLSEEENDILLMKIQGYTFQEIAKSTGISKNLCLKIYHQALDKLQESYA
jgi:RNA polymerase sporulation-specific sigma factor